MNPSSESLRLTDCLLPEWPAPAHVRSCVTTRAGGVSLPPFDRLNLGTHVGDDGLNLVNAHTGLDIVTQVVEQQYPLLVVTDLFLVVRDFTLELVLTTGHTHIFQHIAESRLAYLFHIGTTD